VSQSLVERDSLTRLLTILHTVLEHNVEKAHIMRFKSAVVQRLHRTGEWIERRMPSVPRGDGLKVLLRMYAIVIGLRQLSDPGPVVEEVLREPEMKPLLVEFREELPLVLSAFLRGSTSK
jgi:hypothetical protein